MHASLLALKVGSDARRQHAAIQQVVRRRNCLASWRLEGVVGVAGVAAMSNDQWLKSYLKFARPTESSGSRFECISRGIEHGAMNSREIRRERERLKRRREQFEKRSIAWQRAQEQKAALKGKK